METGIMLERLNLSANINDFALVEEYQKKYIEYIKVYPKKKRYNLYITQ